MRTISIGPLSMGILLAIAIANASGQPAAAAPALDFSALIAAARVRGPIEFCGEPVPLQIQDVRERMEREMLSVLSDPDQVVLWIKRSHQYLVPIEEELRRQRMPQDLKYVAIAESALRPHTGSPKGAMGFWQFIESTGRKYGLQVDSQKDERRSLFQSTAAAVAYLRELQSLFGSWTLAVTAYNMGENGLRNEIRQQGPMGYYDLYLPLETQRYVFRILTAKLILQEPEKYGFRLEPEDIYAPVAFDRVTFAIEKEIPLLVVAQAAEATVKVIKDLNPELRGYRLFPGSHSLLIPKNASRGFHERLAQRVLRLEEERQEITYVVREGDTLSQIAERHGVSVSDIRSWNRLDPKKQIQTGMQLVIQTRAANSPDSGQ
jgi:membrane-bound lytic murein transglycosylase D